MPSTQKTKFKKFAEAYSTILDFGARTQDLRKASILETVIEILANEGVDELTFESIGKRVGMARSHVVYYFKNREALVEAAMRFVAMTAQQFIASRLTGETDWKKLLRNYAEANFAWIEENPEHSAVFLLMYYRAAMKKPYRKMHTEIRSAGAKRIRAILELGPKRSLSEWDALSRGIQGLITGNLVDLMTTEQKGEFKQRKEQTIDLVMRIAGA